MTYDYRVLATSRTSTMEKEMNEAGSASYGFMGVMGGETGVGGKEVVVVMGKRTGADDSVRKKYRLLATQRTGTMQKEMQQAGDGFRVPRANGIRIRLRWKGSDYHPGAGFGPACQACPVQTTRHHKNLDHAKGAEPGGPAGV